MEGGEAWAVTTPLIKKADGTKFGKTEGGNVWLDKNRTSVREFYDYWINASDEDASKYIRIFSLFEKEKIEALEAQHNVDPGKKELQKALAKDITIRVHSQADFDGLGLDMNIMFDRNIGKTELFNLSEDELVAAMDSYPKLTLEAGTAIGDLTPINLLASATGNKVCQSNGEARRELQGNAISVNKEKIKLDSGFGEADFIHGKYLIVSKGKKKHFLLVR